MDNVRTLLEKHLTEDKDILEVIVYICFIMFKWKKELNDYMLSQKALFHLL